MKKKNIILLSVLSVCMIGLAYFYIRLKRTDKTLTEAVVPTLEVTTVDITELTQDHINMRIHAGIHNPDPVGITIDSVAYTIQVEGSRIITSTYNTPIDLKADSFSALTVPLTIYHTQVDAISKKLKRLGKDSAVFKIHATLYSDIFPDNSLDITTEKLMPFIFFPEITVKDISLDKLKPTDAILSIVASIYNRNTFDIDFKNMSYQVQLEDHKTLEGKIPQTVHIKQKDSTSITIPVDLKLGPLASSIGDFIVKGNKLRYKVTLKTQLETDAYAIKGSELLIKAEGNLKQIKEAVKH